MERERGIPKDIQLSAYLKSPFRGLLIIIALAALIKWGIPTTVKAGIALDNKVGEFVKVN